MIDEILTKVLNSGIAVTQESGGLEPWDVMEKSEALTAIYEIGLEVIGEAEELEPLNVWIEKTRNHGGTSEEYWRLYEIINNYNNLREGQRKAWAKACGVAEK